jgi:dUTP pyrophosphatase
MKILVQRLPHAEGLDLPAYATEGSAGMDLVAARGVALAPGARALVPTGLCVAVPDGFEMQIRPRSGLALKHGITVLNAPGTVDSDYRGEVGVILVNAGEEAFSIVRGERIAQAVFAPVTRAEWESVVVLPETARGPAGFGSTGMGSASAAPLTTLLPTAEEGMERLMEAVRALGAAYHQRTGRPLGVNGELGEYLASRHLGLTLLEERVPGVDATRTAPTGAVQPVLIRTRALDMADMEGRRIGTVPENEETTHLVLVLLDEMSLRLEAIWQAPYEVVYQQQLTRGNSRGVHLTRFLALPGAERLWPDPSSSPGSTEED